MYGYEGNRCYYFANFAMKAQSRSQHPCPDAPSKLRMKLGIVSFAALEFRFRMIVRLMHFESGQRVEAALAYGALVRFRAVVCLQMTFQMIGARE